MADKKTSSSYAELLKLLYNKTCDGDLVWTESGSKVTVDLDEYVINILKLKNMSGEPVITVRLIDVWDDLIDEFTDEDLGIPVGPPFSGYESMFAFMTDLHKLAQRNAKGADKALSSVIDILKSTRKGDS